MGGPAEGAWPIRGVRLGDMAHAAVQPSQFTLVARDIKLSHSVFALPFAVLAVFLTGAERAKQGGAGELAGKLGLVVACMVFARTWAMLVNRLADASIDAKNPRTARRVFASGAMTPGQGWLWAGGAAACFVACTSVFGAVYGNWWPLALAAPALGWIALYSWTKRFTWACHLVLGVALAMSPVAAAIAVDPGAVGLSALGGGALAGAMVPAVWWLAGMVVCWVAGFDVIYALQDVDFDRGRGLWSVPSRLGVGRALWMSRGLHVLAAACLLMAWRTDGRFGVVFGIAVGLVAGLLAMEHVVLAKRGQAGLDMAFFTINGIVSVIVGILGCADVIA